MREGNILASMAYAIAHFFPGGTKEHYDAAMTVVHLGEVQLPDGQLFHAAGAATGGWTIIAIHKSKERRQTAVPGPATPG
jgi:hypothetical protein